MMESKTPPSPPKTPPSPPKRRLKLLVWAKERSEERATQFRRASATSRATPEAKVDVSASASISSVDGREHASPQFALQFSCQSADEMVDAIMESLRGLGKERELLSRQSADAELALEASREALARQAASLRDVALTRRNRPSAAVALLREALGLVEHQQGASTVEVALTIHAELARLFASFKRSGCGGLTNLELAASHLSAVNALQEESGLLAGLRREDSMQTHHCLGLASHACGRKHSDASYREMYFQKSEQHLRECLSLGKSLSTSAQAEVHAHLAALYVDMSASASSCLAAGQHHFFEAADKFAAAGLPARCWCRHKVRRSDRQTHTLTHTYTYTHTHNVKYSHTYR